MVSLIDSHVHARDEEQAYKETIKHAKEVALNAGLCAIFTMPNPKRRVRTLERVEDQMQLSYQADLPIVHGIFVEATSDPDQIAEAIRAYNQYRLKDGDIVGTVGLKGYDDHVLTEDEDQKRLYQELFRQDFQGTLVKHCEDKSKINDGFFNPNSPISHYVARGKATEIASIKKNGMYAIETGFAVKGKSNGRIHIAHVSTPEGVDIINGYKQFLNITCEVIPEHIFMNNTNMDIWEEIEDENKKRYFTKTHRVDAKMNPPIKGPQTQRELFKRVKLGMVDSIGSDHAPHSEEDKLEKHMSGTPTIPWWPLYFQLFRQLGVSPTMIDNMAYNHPNQIFRTNIPRLREVASTVNQEDATFYRFNPRKYISLPA